MLNLRKLTHTYVCKASRPPSPVVVVALWCCTILSRHTRSLTCAFRLCGWGGFVGSGGPYHEGWSGTCNAHPYMYWCSFQSFHPVLLCFFLHLPCYTVHFFVWASGYHIFDWVAHLVRRLRQSNCHCRSAYQRVEQMNCNVATEKLSYGQNRSG